MLYLQLFYEFFKTGLFSLGGGLATLPFLSGMAERLPWFTQEQLGTMLAVSESTPGPIGVNMATYAGVQAGGILGGVVATLGLVAPSIIIIGLIATFLRNFAEKPLVKRVFFGLRPAVAGLILAAGASVGTEVFSDLSAQALYIAPILCLATFIGLRATKLHPILFLALGAIVGVLARL